MPGKSRQCAQVWKPKAAHCFAKQSSWLVAIQAVCAYVFASAMERADARAIRSHVDHLTTMDTLQDYTKRCDELLEATLTAQRRAETMEDALSTAQRGYDEQIAIMTEHMVGMNDRAKEQEEQFR
jgi:hypothetical protein